eukprot:GHRR01008007.1.p1 GENE.GHRR01008007.1~~GHRR01008007.1.p1  ORF type:complete len:525 (+),score=250.21 GHRR01008007.1:2350-3924(+)
MQQSITVCAQLACRHYVNSLVQYATGVERSTQHLKRHYFNTRHADKWLWYGWFISATQFVTDVGNWSNVQAGAVVTLLAMTGRSTLAQLKTLTLPAMPAVTQALPSLIPSVRLAAGSGTAGSAIAGTLATTLKLPAAALLKRPLAGSAVAAAGGAGAAAAAIRTHPGAAANEATAAAASASSSNSSSNGAFGSVAMQGGAFRGLALWARPLKHWRDDVGKSLKGAMLSFRRASIGRRERLLEEQQQSQYEACLSNNAAAAGGIAARTVPNTRGWQWGRSAAARQQQLVHAGAAAVNGTGSTQLGHSAVMVLPATAVTGSVTAVTELQDSSSNARLQHQQQGLEQQLGRHVIWLGGNAARATRHATALAGRQVNQIVSRARGHTTVLPGAAAAGGVAYADNATSMLLPHRQQVQQQQRMGLGQRSKSAPNLVVMAAPTAQGSVLQGMAATPAAAMLPAAGAVGNSAAAAHGDNQFVGLGALNNFAFSGYGCSTSRTSGVGHQMLHLPAARVTWGKRAAYAFIAQP